MTLGATLLVDENVWAKPQVEASVVFDGLPPDDDLDEAWGWLWERQILPQSDGLLSVVRGRLPGAEVEE